MQTIVLYKNDYIIGEKCFINEEFKPYMNIFCSFLKFTKCKVWITSSYRTPTDKLYNTIVKPAKWSNHYIGYAIDCNIVDSKGILWNSDKLQEPKDEVLTFIQLIRGNNQLRWGGDFYKKDTVHFDYPVNILDKEKYMVIYNDFYKQNNKV